MVAFDPLGISGAGAVEEIYGLDLPDPVLEKIYHLNAEKMFSRFKGLGFKGMGKGAK